MVTTSDGEQELDQVKFDAWKAEQEAQGNTFPTGKRGKVVDTKELTQRLAYYGQKQGGNLYEHNRPKYSLLCST